MAIDFDEAQDAHDAEVAPAMNTTPLIDVLLVLLVMLIITIPIQLHAVSMEMPSGLPPPDAPDPVVVRLGIDAANQLTWNLEPVPVVVKLEVAVDSKITWNGEAVPDQADLQARLQAAGQLPDQPEIHVHANAKTPYETVAAVLTAAQKHGLMKIGVVGLDEYATPVSAATNSTP